MAVARCRFPLTQTFRLASLLASDFQRSLNGAPADYDQRCFFRPGEGFVRVGRPQRPQYDRHTHARQTLTREERYHRLTRTKEEKALGRELRREAELYVRDVVPDELAIEGAKWLKKARTIIAAVDDPVAVIEAMDVPLAVLAGGSLPAVVVTKATTPRVVIEERRGKAAKRGRPLRQVALVTKTGAKTLEIVPTDKKHFAPLVNFLRQSDIVGLQVSTGAANETSGAFQGGGESAATEEESSSLSSQSNRVITVRVPPPTRVRRDKAAREVEALFALAKHAMQDVRDSAKRFVEETNMEGNLLRSLLADVDGQFRAAMETLNTDLEAAMHEASRGAVREATAADGSW